MSRILGISAYYHGISVALVVAGDIVPVAREQSGLVNEFIPPRLVLLILSENTAVPFIYTRF